MKQIAYIERMIPVSSNSEVVKSIDRALEIIDILYQERQEMRIAEIAKRLDVYQSTIYRALVTLQHRGFVYQNSENSKYGLGMKLYAIGMTVGKTNAFIEMVKPFVKTLANEFRETINVCVNNPNPANKTDNCLLIHQETVPGRILGSSESLGAISESYCSAAGKLLLAYSPEITDADLKSIDYIKYTKNTISDWEELSFSLNEIKKVGFSVDNEEREEGTFCVGCPLLDKNGAIIATISVSGPSSRIHHIGINNIVKRLKQVIGEVKELME